MFNAITAKIQSYISEEQPIFLIFLKNVEILSSFTIRMMNHYSIIIKTEWFLYREEHDRQMYPKYVCMHIQIEHGLQIVKTDKL